MIDSRIKLSLLVTVVGLALAACGDDSASAETGSVTLTVQAEETIPDGLEPGDEEENITDGWTVSYERVLFTMGDVHAVNTDKDLEIKDSTLYLLDLKKIPSTGFPLLEAKDVDAVRYDAVSFENPVAKASFERGPSVAGDDLDMMVDNGWSIYVEGEISKDDGESCTPGSPDECTPDTKVHFALGADAATSYEHCGPEDGDLGFAVASGGTLGATFTIHGDHWFFNAFPEGEEGMVTRQAQWLADADLDHDGETTVEELTNTKASDVFPSASYSLAGSPIPVKTAYDFFVAQSHTIGHFQGEGECEWKVR